MKRTYVGLVTLVVSMALVGAACVPSTPPPTEWKVKPVSITVHDGEDNDGGDEPYVIQVGFRSKVGVPGSSSTSIASQCRSRKLPSANAGTDGATVPVPVGSADISFSGAQTLDILDLAASTAPFEVLGTLSFVMERDGIFEGCAMTDLFDNALRGVLRDALDLLIANSPTPPEPEDLINLLLANLEDFVYAAGSLIAAALEGLGNPDDVIGVAAQIHLPTRGGLTDLVNTGLAIGGIFSPGLENGFIPIEGLPSSLQIRVGTLSPSAANFRFTSPIADYSYKSIVGA